jgi:hypothetical protein
MSGSAVCEECGQRFNPLETKYAEMVRRYAAHGDKTVAIECPHCEEYTAVNPVAIIAGKDGTAVSTPTYRCPVSGCAGWVDYVDNDLDEGPFWGCGECGSVWYEKANLLKEIDQIVKKFKYRKKCYRKSKEEWIPADPDKIPDDYEERVEAEPQDESDDYVRG